MSRLSERLRNRVAALNGLFRVALYGNGVAWAELRRWPRWSLACTPGFVGSGDGACDWNALLELLPATAPAGMPSEIWLSGCHLRYLLVPWTSTIVTDKQTDNYARALFEERFGLDANTQVFRFGPAAYGQPRLACAMASDMLNGLKVRFGPRVGVRPLLAGLINQWRRQLSAARQVVIDVEPARFSGVLIVDGHIQAAISQPLGDDGAEIDQWLRRIAYHNSETETANLWLHDPQNVASHGVLRWEYRRLEVSGGDDMDARVRPILIDPQVLRA